MFPIACISKHLFGEMSWDLYRKGLLTVQGESSMLVCRAADVQPGDRVLDVCAAPGGKTAYLAERKPAYLQAWDLHEHRVQLMQENFTRLGDQR